VNIIPLLSNSTTVFDARLADELAEYRQANLCIFPYKDVTIFCLITVQKLVQIIHLLLPVNAELQLNTEQDTLNFFDINNSWGSYILGHPVRRIEVNIMQYTQFRSSW